MPVAAARVRGRVSLAILGGAVLPLASLDLRGVAVASLSTGLLETCKLSSTLRIDTR